MIKTGVVGSAGYAGQALLDILLAHPNVTVSFITSGTYKGRRLSDVLPVFSGRSSLAFEANDYAELSKKCDAVFLCLPHGASMDVAPIFLDAGVTVFDLSADFRLKDHELYEKWYQTSHTAKSLLDDAVYGLPEIYRSEIAKADLIALPGCYPTSAILALLPALKTGLIDTDSIVINSLSGVTGAGRKATEANMLAELEGNVWAYGAPSHRHTPEIESQLSDIADKNLTVTFIPHLLPTSRGIYTTVTADMTGAESTDEIIVLYRDFYDKEHFVTVTDQFAQMKWAVGTNRIYINAVVDNRNQRLIITSVIDNLIKGAAGQAVQSFNIRFGLDEDAGL